MVVEVRVELGSVTDDVHVAEGGDVAEEVEDGEESETQDYQGEPQERPRLGSQTQPHADHHPQPLSTNFKTLKMLSTYFIYKTNIAIFTQNVK